MQLSTKPHRISANAIKAKSNPGYNSISRALYSDRIMDKNEILLSLAESPRNHGFLQAILSDKSYPLHGHVTMNALEKYSKSFTDISSIDYQAYSPKFIAVKDLLTQFNTLSNPKFLIEKQIALLSNPKLDLSFNFACRLLNEFYKNERDFRQHLLEDRVWKSRGFIEKANPWFIGEAFKYAIEKDEPEYFDEMLQSPVFLKKVPFQTLGIEFAYSVDLDDSFYFDKMLNSPLIMEKMDPEWLSSVFLKTINVDNAKLFDTMLKSEKFFKKAGPLNLGWALRAAIENNKPDFYAFKMLESPFFIERAAPSPLIHSFNIALIQKKTGILSVMLDSVLFTKIVGAYLDDEIRRRYLTPNDVDRLRKVLESHRVMDNKL